MSKRVRRKEKPDERAKIPEIIEQMIEGKSVREICKQEGFPPISTFLTWVAKDEELAKVYAEAMQLRADALFEEMFDIADDGSNDWMERTNKDGDNIGWMVNGECVNRSKLRVDARKWALAKMHPKKYGEKVDLNHGGRVKVVSVDRDDEAL